VLLASVIASSSVAKVVIVLTGPKISSFQIVIDGFTPVITVGDTNLIPRGFDVGGSVRDAPSSRAKLMSLVTFAAASSEIKGPTCVFDADPSPTTSSFERVIRRAVNAGAIF
jgi:hypothetical protein